MMVSLSLGEEIILGKLPKRSVQLLAALWESVLVQTIQQPCVMMVSLRLGETMILGKLPKRSVQLLAAS